MEIQKTQRVSFDFLECKEFNLTIGGNLNEPGSKSGKYQIRNISSCQIICKNINMYFLWLKKKIGHEFQCDTSLLGEIYSLLDLFIQVRDQLV